MQEKGGNMYSALAVTNENFDMTLAASDLAAQIKKQFPPTANSCGIVFADPDYDLDLLLSLLREALGIDAIIGSTSAAMLSSQGYHAMCATLLVMGGDDCVFGSAMSAVLTADNAEQELCKTYDRALAKLQGHSPVMIFAFSASGEGCSEDRRLTILRQLGNDIPVFGGVAADHFEFAHTRVAGEDRSSANSVVLLLAGGNIRPQFVLRSVARKHLSSSTVTGAEGNYVHTIDGMSAYDYMTSQKVDVSSAMALHFTPLLVETKGSRTDDKHIICRPFISLDPVSGYGQTICGIPTGSAVTVQSIQGKDIADASKDAMEALMKKITAQEDGSYRYSTVLAFSCAARHMVLAYDKEREAALAKDVFPAELAVFGFYSFGELCPIAFVDGVSDNCLHNLSLGLCAL